MFIFEFKKKAAKEIDKLPFQIRQRILKKLKFYSSQGNLLRFAEKLRDWRFGEYRFRIGDYRIFYFIDEGLKKVILVDIKRRTTQTYH